VKLKELDVGQSSKSKQILTDFVTFLYAIALQYQAPVKLFDSAHMKVIDFRLYLHVFIIGQTALSYILLLY